MSESSLLGAPALLALDGLTLVVLDVRSTAGDDIQKAARSVDADKQRRLTEATLRFLTRKGLLNRLAVRFDVMAISWPPESREPRVLHLRHAFESVGRFQLHS